MQIYEVIRQMSPLWLFRPSASAIQTVPGKHLVYPEELISPPHKLLLVQKAGASGCRLWGHQGDEPPQVISTLSICYKSSERGWARCPLSGKQWGSWNVLFYVNIHLIVSYIASIKIDITPGLEPLTQGQQDKLTHWKCYFWRRVFFLKSWNESWPYWVTHNDDWLHPFDYPDGWVGISHGRNQKWILKLDFLCDVDGIVVYLDPEAYMWDGRVSGPCTRRGRGSHRELSLIFLPTVLADHLEEREHCMSGGWGDI